MMWAAIIAAWIAGGAISCGVGAACGVYEGDADEVGTTFVIMLLWPLAFVVAPAAFLGYGSYRTTDWLIGKFSGPQLPEARIYESEEDA